jgi:hypothetical protein
VSDKVDRTRHYGLAIGDEVEERMFGFVTKGKVVEFHWLDNNRAYIQLESGEIHPVVAEWCTIIKHA